MKYCVRMAMKKSSAMWMKSFAKAGRLVWRTIEKAILATDAKGVGMGFGAYAELRTLKQGLECVSTGRAEKGQMQKVHMVNIVTPKYTKEQVWPKRRSGCQAYLLAKPIETVIGVVF